MTTYLEKNLLPHIDSIKAKKTESYLLISAGLGDTISQNGVLIQLGNRLELFWDKVISDCAINLTENSDRIFVGAKIRQLDHMFMLKNSEEIIYLESKSNMNFDTEKKPASNNKICRVKDAIFEKYGKVVNAGYFIPCVRNVPIDVTKRYPDINVYSVEWLLNSLGETPFTCDEFFDFFKNVIGPVISKKLDL